MPIICAPGVVETIQLYDTFWRFDTDKRLYILLDGYRNYQPYRVADLEDDSEEVAAAVKSHREQWFSRSFDRRTPGIFLMPNYSDMTLQEKVEFKRHMNQNELISRMIQKQWAIDLAVAGGMAYGALAVGSKLGLVGGGGGKDEVYRVGDEVGAGGNSARLFGGNYWRGKILSIKNKLYRVRITAISIQSGSSYRVGETSEFLESEIDGKVN